MGPRAAKREPRRLSAALPGTLDASAPATTLAQVQRIWQAVAGPGIAAQAEPVRERAGVVTIACRTAAWAAELDLRQSDLIERIVELLGPGAVGALRFTAEGLPASRGGPAKAPSRGRVST
jgi:predicted nucleic acid-binding Zn ribbon protein